MDMIEELSERVISNRKYVLSDGQEAGPIWLGTRTASTRTVGDYSLIIYKKGALVLRMLQIMMSGPEAGMDSSFRNMMRDYYGRFRGERADTEDFIDVVSEHMQMDMHWFFDQWIYGTHIPYYEYGYRVRKTEEGDYLLDLRVRQENVPEDFRMPVPFRIIFEDEDQPSYRDIIMVDGRFSEKTIKVANEPDELIFNADRAVLAERDENDYEDLIEP
jgi:aminopeptidase N